jgi:hypothetical protein
MGRERCIAVVRHVEDAAWSEQIFRESEGESIKKLQVNKLIDHFSF